MKGILLADSGATKTSWSLLSEETNDILRMKSDGLNPAHNSLESLKEKMLEVKNFYGGMKIRKICFYGAGCATPDLKDKIESCLKHYFKPCEIIIESDIMAAANSLFGNKEGVACILGTGSNSALVSNGEIIDRIPSMGYILGDEGSGVALGRTLLNAIFKRTLPDDVTESFHKEYNVSIEKVIKKVYQEPGAPAYIASFAPFLHKNIHLDEIRLLVESSIDDFFIKNILPYLKIKNYKVGFVGSIAYNFKDIVNKIASKYGISVVNILKEPMPMLEQHFLEQ